MIIQLNYYVIVPFLSLLNLIHPFIIVTITKNNNTYIHPIFISDFSLASSLQTLLNHIILNLKNHCYKPYYINIKTNNLFIPFTFPHFINLFLLHIYIYTL